jgi:hypothetical protein
MTRRCGLLLAAAAGTGLILLGCGGSPTSPSNAAGVNLHGVAIGQNPATSSAPGLHTMSGSSGLTVTVNGTSMTTQISANGTFELDGLPSGTLTLVFANNGVTIGTITITNVPTTAEIDLVVQITGNAVIKVKVEINGADHTNDDNNNNNTTKTCMIDGGTVGQGIELEGSVSSATSGSKTFQMDVNGERSSGAVMVDATHASFDCAGIKGACDASLLVAGAKVHVSGTLTSCSLTAAQVTATEVKFQH